MKKKTKLIFSFLIAVFAVMLTHGCDMDLLDGDLNRNGSANPFPGGSGLDPSVIPCLTIVNLPAGTLTDHFSNVFVYNSFGTAIAKCSNYNQIVITTGSDHSTAKIPLAYLSGEPFRDSGNYNSSFSLYIEKKEVSKDDSYTANNSLFVTFDYGSGTFDFFKDASSSVELGYFSGGLDNPADTAAPVIRGETVFEMNGGFYTVNSKTAVQPSSFSNTCVVYIYARLVFNKPEFILSTTAPVYDYYKKGYYNGLERALYKLVFIRDSSNKYFAKTFINDEWGYLLYHTVDSGALASQNLYQHYYLSGTGNPGLHSVTFPPGVYLFSLYGAAGSGAQGGAVSEVVALSRNTSFSFFTGTTGGGGTSTRHESQGSPTGGGGGSITVYGGGGGGCGAFAFSPEGYLLCAGGGGGSYTAPTSDASHAFGYSGSGGAGGSIGGGGRGQDAHINTYPPISPGSGGGSFNGLTPLTSYSFSLGYEGNGAQSAAYFNLPAPYGWLNTNNANGTGASANGTAQAGGNNRNSVRGGNVGNGSVTVYKIN
jgi:hypothetical protein